MIDPSTGIDSLRGSVSSSGDITGTVTNNSNPSVVLPLAGHASLSGTALSVAIQVTVSASSTKNLNETFVSN